MPRKYLCLCLLAVIASAIAFSAYSPPEAQNGTADTQEAERIPADSAISFDMEIVASEQTSDGKYLLIVGREILRNGARRHSKTELRVIDLDAKKLLVSKTIDSPSYAGLASDDFVWVNAHGTRKTDILKLQDLSEFKSISQAVQQSPYGNSFGRYFRLNRTLLYKLPEWKRVRSQEGKESSQNVVRFPLLDEGMQRIKPIGDYYLCKGAVFDSKNDELLYLDGATHAKGFNLEPRELAGGSGSQLYPWGLVPKGRSIVLKSAPVGLSWIPVMHLKDQEAVDIDCFLHELGGWRKKMTHRLTLLGETELDSSRMFDGWKFYECNKGMAVVGKSAVSFFSLPQIDSQEFKAPLRVVLEKAPRIISKDSPKEVSITLRPQGDQKDLYLDSPKLPIFGRIDQKKRAVLLDRDGLLGLAEEKLVREFEKAGYLREGSTRSEQDFLEHHRNNMNKKNGWIFGGALNAIGFFINFSLSLENRDGEKDGRSYTIFVQIDQARALEALVARRKRAEADRLGLAEAKKELSSRRQEVQARAREDAEDAFDKINRERQK